MNEIAVGLKSTKCFNKQNFKNVQLDLQIPVNIGNRICITYICVYII